MRNYSIKINRSVCKIHSQRTCFGFFNCNHNTNSSEATVLQPTALPHTRRLAILTAWNRRYAIRKPRRMRTAYLLYTWEKRNATKISVQKSEEAICRRITLQKSRSQYPRGLRRRSAAARLLRSWVRIPPRAWMFVCRDCCVLSGRGLCDELITRPEESYLLWCVVVCDQETSRMRRPWPTLGRSATEKKLQKNSRIEFVWPRKTSDER